MRQTVSAVILNRGDTTMLKDLLESLKKTTPAEVQLQVVLVEHATQQIGEDIQELLKLWPGSVYLPVADEPMKESFSSLNNKGVEHATGEYIWLLNNDVVVHAGCLEEMLATLENFKDVGIVGAKLLLADGTIQHAGVYFDNHLVPQHLGYGRRNTPDFPASQRSEYAEAVTFACVLIRRQVWRELNGLDEEYHFNYEDIDFCLKARQKGWRCYFPHKAVSTHFQSQSRNFRNTQQHSISYNIEVFQKKWVTNGILEDLIGIRRVRAFSPMKDKLLNIAFIPAGEGAGISWWRMLLPAWKLSKKRLANVQIIQASIPEAKINLSLGLADLVVWQAFFNESVKRIATLKNGRDWAMVYEYDDHPIYLSPFAACYRGLGTKEEQIMAKDGSKIWLWRDGEGGFDLERNRENRQRQLEIISAVEGVTTTTEPLAGFFKTFNPNVYAIPNCIDFDFYHSPDRLWTRKPGPVRIGWWGGDNHWHDISVIGKALTKYVNEHDVTLVLMGAFYRGPLRGIDLNKVEEHPWIHVEAWPWKLGGAGLDVALVPLAPPALPGMRFNHFKSDIKWLEASAMKIPAVVQGGVRPYENCVDGDNAFTFTNDEEFIAKLDEACRNQERAKAIAQRAYDWTREYRDLDKEAYRWLQAYEDIIKKKPPVVPEQEAVKAG